MSYRRALRPMSDKVYAERRAAGEQTPYSTFRREGVHRLPEKPTKRHPTPTGPDQKTRQLVLQRALRDGGTIHCEVCAVVVWGPYAWVAYSIHHRRGREGERTDNSPANLLLCCGTDNQTGCHGEIHKRRSWSQPLGFWIPRNGIRVPPALIPVTIDRGSRVVYFDHVGGYSDSPPLDGAL